MFNNFVDKLLEKNDKEVVIALFKQGSTEPEIAEEMNMSRVWVEEVVDEFRAECSNYWNSMCEHND